MAEVSKASKPPHPLKRLLKKASRSKVSLPTQEVVVETDAPIIEEDLTLQRQTSMAVTVPEEQPEPAVQQSPVAELPEPPSSPKEAGRRASLVGKIKNLAGERKAKKNSPKEEVLEQVEEFDSEQVVSTSPNQSTDPVIKPIHVAKRVKDLFSAGPPFYPTTLIASVSPDGVSATALASDTPEQLIGATFLATLSDQALMAGSSTQESVWKLLDRAQFGFRAINKYTPGVSITAADDGQPDSSIMLCVPLIPDENTQVELADFTLVRVPLDETDGQASTSSWWPPWEWGKKSPDPPTKTIRVWIPSTTKISVQLAWWGFRLWMPEPVLKTLGDSESQIVKRAAMISTALGWLVNHIPTTGLPLELLAVLTVAKALVPIIGYIGSFVSWYWSTVTSFDKGEGIVLSATWLLPIALIPGHWDYTAPATPTTPTSPTTPAPDPSTPVVTPAPAPAPTPTPTNPTMPSPTNPPAGSNPPVGTSPPPSLPSTGDGSPVIVIPPSGGIYVS